MSEDAFIPKQSFLLWPRRIFCFFRVPSFWYFWKNYFFKSVLKGPLLLCLQKYFPTKNVLWQSLNLFPSAAVAPLRQIILPFNVVGFNELTFILLILFWCFCRYTTLEMNLYWTWHKVKFTCLHIFCWLSVFLFFFL